MSMVEMGAWISAIAQLRGVKLDEEGTRTIRSLRRKPKQRRRR